MRSVSSEATTPDRQQGKRQQGKKDDLVTDKDIIHYEATVDDPKAFTRPFTISFQAMVRGRADHQIFEYACPEGNRNGILMATGVDIDPSHK